VTSPLRPLACDFRRLRFSRNACLSRSCLGSFVGSFVAFVPGPVFKRAAVCPSLLSLSFFIVDLSASAGEHPMAETHAAAGFASTRPGRLTSLRCFRRSGPAGPAVVGAYCLPLALRAIADPGPARGPAGADHGGADLLRILPITALLSAAPATSRWNSAPISANGSSGASTHQIQRRRRNDRIEVMVRPIRALAALREEMGNRIGPELSRLKQLAGLRG
jgi:hypothetical protein